MVRLRRERRTDERRVRRGEVSLQTEHAGGYPGTVQRVEGAGGELLVRRVGQAAGREGQGRERDHGQGVDRPAEPV